MPAATCMQTRHGVASRAAPSTLLLQALEALRKLKNEKAADVKLLTLEKTNLNTLKDTAARFRDDVRTQGEALEEKEGHRRHLQEEMKVSEGVDDILGVASATSQPVGSAEGALQADIGLSSGAQGSRLDTGAAGTGADTGCW